MGMIFLNGNEYTSSPKDGFPPIIYSNEEREVGVWTDGKPLYQKTYNNISITNEVDFIVDSSFTNKSLIKYEVDFRGIPNQDAKFSVATSDTLYINSNNQLVYYLSRSGSWWNLLSSADITVWYTKTTDVAGSGKYTTYGGIAHHYSTSEQVIGTWIDGKPLYEKIITGISYTAKASWQSTGITIQNLDKVISCKFAQASGNTTYSFVDYFICRNGGNGAIEAWSTSPEQYTYDVAMVQYTKTTD